MAPHPNILLLVSDDHRGDAIAALGEPLLRTPHWDALIARGVCFTRNRHQGGNSGAVCVPTRAALHSGRGVHRCTIDQFRRGDLEATSTLRPDSPTLGQTFGAAGYDTFMTGKWHNDIPSLNRSSSDGRGILSHQDAQVGRILDALGRTGQLDRTIVVYTGDHGLAIGRHGLMGKQNLYEPSVRVPLVLAGPGLPEGLRHGALTHTIDVYPTLCELAGIQAPDTVEGISLTPLFDGRADSVRDLAFCAYCFFHRMATDGRWKLIRSYRDGNEGTDRVQLFDLEGDPDELRDQARDPNQRDVMRSLAAGLTEWMKAGDDPLADVPVLAS